MTTKKENPIKNFKKNERLISSVSSLTNEQKKELSLKNVFALLSNCDIIK